MKEKSLVEYFTCKAGLCLESTVFCSNLSLALVTDPAVLIVQTQKFYI